MNLQTFVTPFAERLYSDFNRALAVAQHQANVNEAPVGIWRRDGWYTVCEIPPDYIEPDPELVGWGLYAIADPRTLENY